MAEAEASTGLWREYIEGMYVDGRLSFGSRFAQVQVVKGRRRCGRCVWYGPMKTCRILVGGRDE